MKNRIAIIAGCAALAVVSIANSFSDASPKLKAFAANLFASQNLAAKYSIQPVGGTPVEYNVSLAKPDKARIESDSTLIVADGKTITTYNKSANTYMSKAQTETALLNLFNDTEISVWKPFFKSECVNDFAFSKDSGTKNRGGKTLNVINVKPNAKIGVTLNLYIDDKNNLQQGEIITEVKGQEPNTEILIMSEQGVASDGLFAFKAPAGSKEVKESDMVAGEWGHDFYKALEMAKASGKLVMVDFMASWCGPCKKMDAEVFHSDKFKEIAKDFVLVKVDVDEQQDIAQKYGISAMPTVKFIRGDGSVAHEYVGYANPDQVYGEIMTAKSKK